MAVEYNKTMRVGFILVMLVGSVLAVNQITTVTEAAKLATMQSDCNGAPVSNLNLCNNTCRECSSSSSYKCASCPEQFKLAGGSCQLDSNIHSFTYHNYLNDLNAELMAADLQQFVYGDIHTPILVNKVLEVCSKNTYEMFMAGPFKDTNVVGIDYQLTDSIDQIHIKFNFMSLIANMTLLVDINEKTVFQKKFNIFSDLQGTYGKNPNNAGPNYMFLSALTASNVGSVITPVDTGVVPLISNDLRIRIYIKAGQADAGYSWGLNDVVIVKRGCETCVSKAVTEMMDSVGTLCMWVLLVVVCLLVLLLAMIKLEALQRRWESEARLGSADALPLNAINRLLATLDRNAKAMHSEFKREERHFLRVMDRLGNRE